MVETSGRTVISSRWSSFHTFIVNSNLAVIIGEKPGSYKLNTVCSTTRPNGAARRRVGKSRRVGRRAIRELLIAAHSGAFASLISQVTSSCGHSKVWQLAIVEFPLEIFH